MAHSRVYFQLACSMARMRVNAAVKPEALRSPTSTVTSACRVWIFLSTRLSWLRNFALRAPRYSAYVPGSHIT